MAVAQRMYARALFEAAQEAGGVDAVAATSPRSRARWTTCPSCARSCATRRSSRPARPRCSSSSRPTPTSSSATSSGSSPRRAAPASSPEISAELDALVAQAQNRLTVELTTSHELSDEEAQSIVQTIEKASGRTVEATRTVDPSLIGGIVLQIGSHRADGSVRGRLELERLAPRADTMVRPLADRGRGTRLAPTQGDT